MADRVLSRVLVKPGVKVRLDRRDPAETFGWNKTTAQAQTAKLARELDLLQAKLWADQKRALLVVLQARDAAGKDGVIRTVFTGMNPAGVKVTSFKAPVGRELMQDYLWRCHLALPGKGEVGVFNRSHYEDVLVVRVRNLAPEERWRKRFRHIREFEQMLADEGTVILKLYLNISQEEQRLRFQDRIDDPNERWKFRAADLEDRKMWDAYTEAYEDAINETSTASAPWFVVPGDRKWVRNLVVSKILLDALTKIDPKFPEPEENIVGTKVT
jgi:PPK2 family polyphosphate:nucleotide phosphotransferase